MKHTVFLVHGINTYAEWHEKIRPILEREGFSVKQCSYGHLSILAFLIPWPFSKKRAIKKVERQIKGEINKSRPEKISVIAHSFGTYVVAHVLARNCEIKWENIIFCGSVLSENFPFEKYRDRFDEIINEVGQNDFYPALAQSITWGYGSIGAHGLRDPAARNRWHRGFGHSDFLNEPFCKKYWVPYLKYKKLETGDAAGSTYLSRLISALNLRWIIVILICCLVLMAPYIYINPHTISENVVGCDMYKKSQQSEWRQDNLLADNKGSYYVILDSFYRLRYFPSLGDFYANLEADRIRRKFPKIDVDTFESASTKNDNKMWTLLLARGILEDSKACTIAAMANICGLSAQKDAYVYRLGFGTVKCPKNLED